MTTDSLRSSFSSDRRAVSAVLGFILLFGILMLVLATYQAQIVPQQNAQAEHQHFVEAQNDFVELRSGIFTASHGDEDQSIQFTLGTTYQTRVAVINPPPPAGTLQTSDQYNITISNSSADVGVPTQFLQYQPGFNEIETGSLWYEQSLLYLDDSERDQLVILEDQQVVSNNETVRLTALQNSIDRTDTGDVELALYTTRDEGVADDIPDGEVTVEIPTRLNESEYWGDELNETDQYNGVDTDAFPGESDVYGLNLSVTANNIQINTVGIEDDPSEAAAKQQIGESPPPDELSESESEIEELQIENVVEDEEQDQLFEITLESSLESGDTLEFNLESTEDDIEYPNPDNRYTVDEGSGNAASIGTPPITEFAYTASDDDEGETLEINVEDVDVDEVGGEVFPVTVETPSGEETPSFVVLEEGDFNFDDYEGGDIYAGGDVEVPDDEEVDGEIIAEGEVDLGEGASAGDIDAEDEVELDDGASAGDINSENEVDLGEDAAAGDVDAENEVELDDGASAGDIDSEDEVDIGEDASAGDIDAENEVELDDGASAGDIDADEEVDLGEDASAGAIDSSDEVELDDGASAQRIESDDEVDLGDDATVAGDVIVGSGDDISCGDGSTIDGQPCDEYVDQEY